MTDFSQLTALIIDPSSGMRANLHNMLNLCQMSKIDHAVSAGTAIRQLQGKTYDIVICEYDLGEGQDGQQLLEDLRHNRVITPWAIYFIVTAERAFTKVVSAAELGPTDYILKPFTADMLLERIARALEKRDIFKPVHVLISQSRLREAVEACVAGIVSQPRHANDFLRLQAELHMAQGEAPQAEAIYRQLIELRTVSWARLGLAKALYHQEQLGVAENLLTELLEENNRYMDAYDWLAKTHEKAGQLAQAQQVLQEAILVSPHAVRRLRRLGEVALEAGDVSIAERSFQQVVNKARYSVYRDPEDHVKLVKTLVTKGDTQQAAVVIRDLQKSLSGNENMPACRSLSSALLHETLGEKDRAVTELQAAVTACREQAGMSAEMKMLLANTCLTNNLEQGASDVMLDVMNNAANGHEMAKAMRVFERHGRTDLAEKTAQESRRQVVELVNSGADKVRQGDYKGGVEAMQAAVQKLPDNPQVIFNAALAILKYLENVGWDNQMDNRCRVLIDRARQLEPTNPRLTSLSDLYLQISHKHKKS